MKSAFLRSARAILGAAILVPTLAIAGCALGSAPAAPQMLNNEPTPNSAFQVDGLVTLISVTDGDTIVTSAGNVRLIGIDTPERGECGYEEAAAAIRGLLSTGDPVTLVLPPGQNDTDKYERLLRYVYTAAGEDVGLAQLEGGHAIARYDSRDGYPEHPYENVFHDAQIATKDTNGNVLTTSCGAPSAEEKSPAGIADFDSDGDNWWTNYSSCSKLKKNTVGDPKGPFDVNNPAEKDIYDWFQYGTGHRGDGDGDGLACE